MKEHRGGLILALGIIGIVLCQVCAPIAWVLGDSDLKDMRGGRMDPSGEQLTNAGRILGIIGTVLFGLWCCALIAYFAFIASMIGAAGAGAAGGGGF